MLKQQTFVMIKPLGALHLMPEILSSLRTVGNESYARYVKVPEVLIAEHYREHRDKDFFPELIRSYRDITVLASIWEGDDIIARVRDLIGPTNPRLGESRHLRRRVHERFPDCKNGWETLEQLTREFDNAIHASDSEEEAHREITLWLPYMID